MGFLARASISSCRFTTRILLNWSKEWKACSSNLLSSTVSTASSGMMCLRGIPPPPPLPFGSSFFTIGRIFALSLSRSFFLGSFLESLGAFGEDVVVVVVVEVGLMSSTSGMRFPKYLCAFPYHLCSSFSVMLGSPPPPPSPLPFLCGVIGRACLLATYTFVGEGCCWCCVFLLSSLFAALGLFVICLRLGGSSRMALSFFLPTETPLPPADWPALGKAGSAGVVLGVA